MTVSDLITKLQAMPRLTPWEGHTIDLVMDSTPCPIAVCMQHETLPRLWQHDRESNQQWREREYGA